MTKDERLLYDLTQNIDSKPSDKWHSVFIEIRNYHGNGIHNCVFNKLCLKYNINCVITSNKFYNFLIEAINKV